MKAKFTLLIVAGLFISATTMAQDYGHRDNGFKNDSRYERRENFDYKSQLFNLQEKLSFEINQLDRARACRDWSKVKFEKRQIADLQRQISFLKRHKYIDHDYNSRF
jgi:hypothetical protein